MVAFVRRPTRIHFRQRRLSPTLSRVFINTDISPPQANLSLQGFAPTVFIAVNTVITPPQANLILTGPVAVTLDLNALGPGASLSNGNLTVTSSGTTGNTLATAHSSSGKKYYEFTVDDNGDIQVGLMNADGARTEYLGENSSHSIGNYGPGGSWLGAGGTTTGIFLVTGRVNAVAIDLDNKKAWIKDLTGGSDWNSNATADPATGVNGATFSSVTGEIYPAIAANTASDQVTFNFGASAYIGTIPSGYESWSATNTQPTVVVTNNVSISPSQGNLVLSPTAPSAARTENRDISSPQGNLILSPTAPTADRTEHVFINPSQGNLILSANAPEVQTGAGINKSPPQGDLTLSSTAPSVAQTLHVNISVPQGNLTLSGTAPSATIAINVFPASRDLVLSPTAPTVARTSHHFANPSQGNLTLSSTTPSIGESPLQGNLVLSATAPIISIAIAVFPGSRDLVLSPTAPTVVRSDHRNVSVPQANLVLSATVPTDVVDWAKFPAVRDLVLSPTVPSVVRTAHRNIIVPQANLNLTAEAPSTGGAMNRLPPQGNVVLSSVAPSVVRTAHHFRTPPTRDIFLSPVAPTFFASDLHPITVPQGNLTLSTLPAQLIPGLYQYPIAGDLILSTTSPIVVRDKTHPWRRPSSLQGNIRVNESIVGNVSPRTGLTGNIDQIRTIEGG